MKFLCRKKLQKLLLNCRTLVFLAGFTLTISILYYLVFTSNLGYDYDYSHFGHESMELLGRKNNSGAGHKFRPEVVRKRHNQKIQLPLIFIGGYPRSGTRLIKNLIERYGNVQCNFQTHVMTEVLKMKFKWEESEKEVMRLEEAGIDEAVLFGAFSAFMRETVFGQSPSNTNTLCVHESYSYRYATYLNKIFPNSRFVFVVRDGRAVIQSLMLEKPKENSFVPMFTSYDEGFQAWEDQIKELLSECARLRQSRCHILRIEDLFTSPEQTIHEFSKFIGIPMHLDGVDFKSWVNSTPGVLEFLSRRKALTQDELHEAAAIGHTLEALGYDPKIFVPPRYGSIY